MTAEKEKVVGLYIRVSSGDGRQNPQMQEDELRTMASRRGWRVHRVYSDRESGAKVDRPGLAAMWADCRRGALHAVCVWSIDRLARSMGQLVQSLETFRELGVDFVSLRQDLDTTSSAGRLLYHVIASVAVFERELARERIISGLSRARREGRRLGRPRKKIFSVAEVQQIQAARRTDHASIRALARRFASTEYLIHKALGSTAGTTGENHMSLSR
jgi:DNA invertase Pin-like site-specific DNA recombinase